MLIVKTKFGDFGNFKDLYLFMKEQNLKEIEVDTNYIFDNVCKITLNIKQVEKLK